MSTIYAFLEENGLLHHFPEAEPPRAQECVSWRAPMSEEGQMKATELSAQEASDEVRQKRLAATSSSFEPMTQMQGHPQSYQSHTQAPNAQVATSITSGGIASYFQSVQQPGPAVNSISSRQPHTLH